MSRRPTSPRVARQPRASHYVRERAALEGSELSRLKFELAARGLSPRRRFGQNFLVRRDLAERIVEHARLRADDVVVEIGPGAGALTVHVAGRVRHLIAVEKDDGLAAYLADTLAAAPGFELVHGDVLDLDFPALAARHGTRLVVIGNIPYNITTPILERLFAHKAVIARATLLVQKEYAERLAAAPGDPAYGALTVFARFHSVLEPVMTLRAAAFWPQPDVDSLLVRFHLREEPPVEVPDEAGFFRIVRGAFHMRRKQLGNTLEATLGLGKPRVERLCRHARIDPRRRGETLSLEEFARLARAAADYESAPE